MFDFFISIKFSHRLYFEDHLFQSISIPFNLLICGESKLVKLKNSLNIHIPNIWLRLKISNLLFASVRHAHIFILRLYGVQQRPVFLFCQSNFLFYNSKKTVVCIDIWHDYKNFNYVKFTLKITIDINFYLIIDQQYLM